MLFCCSQLFAAQRRIVLPARNHLYRCFEYAQCPHCGKDVSRLVTQDFNYEVTAKVRKGVKALRELNKAIAEKARHDAVIRHGTNSNQNFYYGTFKKTRRLDERSNPIYVQQRCNFNNQVQDLGDVVTRYYSLAEA